ncbi:MAG TPA: DUF3313 family protein [Myxococcota bacterium]|nr:DUF3313 family protein [Myxococcota bacterium]
MELALARRASAALRRRAVLRLTLTAAVSSCLGLGALGAATSAKAAEGDADGEITEDGLQRVAIRGAGTFWVRPNVDLGAYDRVALKPLRLEYKNTPRHHRIGSLSAGVLLTDRELEHLQEWFYSAFKQGLARGEGFGPASQPEPGLLWVSAALVDVVVRNSQRPTTNEVSFNQDYGEMTLRVEFSDSETGEALARFEERRTIGPSEDFIDRLFSYDHYSYGKALRANFARWSEIVRKRMHAQRSASVRF